MAIKPDAPKAPKVDTGGIDVSFSNRPSFNTDIDVGSRPGFNSSPGGAVSPQSFRSNLSATARAAGDALQNAWNSIRGGPKKPGNLVDGALSKPKPLPDADVPKTKQDLIDGGLKDGPDTDAALKNADELAKDPSVSRTLQKWGIRGGVGVVFLMMLYNTANPFEALSKAGKDAIDGAKGLSEFMNSIFEAIKGLLDFLTQNWMVSAASSCCCVLLMILPMIMGAGRAVAPRPSRFGGAYY